jgi:hypothetical protein
MAMSRMKNVICTAGVEVHANGARYRGLNLCQHIKSERRQVSKPIYRAAYHKVSM